MANKKSAVEKLIEKAEGYKANEKIALALTALIALGENATHSNVEYKKLKALVETAEAHEATEDGAGDESNTEDEGAENSALDEKGDAIEDQENTKNVEDGAGAVKSETPKEVDQDETEDLKNEDVEEDQTPEVKKAYNYDGVKMIGNKWYCAKDKYKKGFATANQCADHYNG
jgi:hypothetical protein